MTDESKTRSPHKIRISDDPNAPMIYVDGCIGGGPSGHNLLLTFAAPAVDHTKDPPDPYLVTNLRLVLPLHAAKNLADFINTLVEPASEEEVPSGRSIQ